MAPTVREQFARNDFGGGLGYEMRMFGGSLGSEQIRGARRWLIVAGALALITGFVAIAVPAIASVTTTIFVGWILIAAAILIAASLPSSAAWAIGLLIGISLIYWGVRALVGARLLKELTSS